jgi:hypothetical protein
MSSQLSGSSGARPPSPALPPKPGEPKFNTQETAGFRQNWPAWMKQLPRWSFPKEPNPNYQLIDRQKLREHLAKLDAESVKRIEEDLDFLDHELLRLFRDRDFQASQSQNMYRLYQIGFMLLAGGAALIGSLQALALNNSPDAVPIFSLLETIVALVTTYLATISGREPPLPLWLQNRRRAENLRREYFRYLMNMPPYDVLDGYKRRMTLSQRAADINRGVYPEIEGEEGIG